MHLLGLGGHMRRIYNPTQYEFLRALQPWNVLITVAAFGLAFAQLPFVVNFFWSLFRGRQAPVNPWQANTLEWAAPSPPPHLNWGPGLPTVYRGPYEYGHPESEEDFLPQGEALASPAGRER